MINTEIRCKECNCPLPQLSGGHRKREFCNDACKQRHYRYLKREEQERARRAHWNGFLPATQQALEDVMQLHSVELAERVASALSSEIAAHENELHQLHTRLAAIQSVEERFHTDTEARHFKTWLRKQGLHPQGSFAERFLNDTRLPTHASRALYEARLKHYGYSLEDIQVFQEHWKALLIAQT